MLDVSKLTPEQIEANYVELRDRMNSLSFGYAPTQTGIEFVLLKRFFTPEDVVYWLEMDPDKYFIAQEYAERTGLTLEKATEVLEDMAHRGLLYRVRRGGRAEFHVVPVAHGVYEFNLNHLDETGWTMALGGHFGQGLLPQVYNAKIPFYRSVPMNLDVVKNGEVYPYDDIVETVHQYKKFGLSPCTCRSLNKILGAPDMGFPMDTCITCGEFAEYYIENGIAEEIPEERVLEILKSSADAGLVIQCVHSKASEIICSCHVDGCGILQAAKMFPGNANKNITHYYVDYNKDACVGCGACVKRCAMHALSLDENRKVVMDHSCVGCGQCVPVCPMKARIMVKKDPSEVPVLPDTIFDAYQEMQVYRRTEGDLSKA